MLKPKSHSSQLGRCILAAAIFGIFPVGLSRAQDDVATPPGVSVPESPGASEQLDKARDKEQQKQWKTAAEYYQDALSKFPTRVVPVVRDSEKNIFQYSGIASIVQERISKWPAEGLTIYRNQYGPTAADLFANAPPGDVAALGNIFWTYFVTDAGKTAGIRLMDADLEAGDFIAARWIGNRLLNLHPLLGGDRGMITYRTAIACQWAGDVDQAKSLLNRLKLDSPTDVGSIGGKDVLLVDALTAALAVPTPLPTTRPTDADTYPSYGGTGGRGSISTSSAKLGASLNSVELTPPDNAGLVGSQRNVFQATDQQTLSTGLAMGIMPVVDAGALFFQDGRCVYAVDADSGAALPGWLSTYGGDRQGRYKLNVFGRARNELLTVSVSPSSVLAVMGQPDRLIALNGQMGMPNGMQMGVQTPVSTVKLVCLDRDTGREKWNRTPAELPESAAALRTAEYGGTPLIVPASQTGGEDSVLVVARGSKENQFDDCYIVSLNEKTGKYQWSSYIGSATRNIDTDGFASDDPSMTALANGRVFVMTNLGTVASLDPADGRLQWVNSYNRDASDNPDVMMMQRRRLGGPGFGQPMTTTSNPKIWAHNPVFVSDGNVFALPCDAKQLFVYDAGSGELKKTLAMTGDWENASVMLGVRDGLVCLTSDKGVFMIDWKKFQDGDQKSASKWARSDIAAMTSDQSSRPIDSDVFGRGFITANSIFVPTKDRLVQMAWKDGRIQQFYPATGQFSGDQGPGNILVTSQNIVVAGQTRVDVYTDLSLVGQRYQLAMSAAPTDPEPRIRYAEALFSGGQIALAIERVDEAISLIGGNSAMRSGRNRDMIFNAMLDFAKRSSKIADPDKKQQSVAFANQFYDRAAAAADTPLQNATYRLARAAFDHEQKDYTGEVKLCQEVLSDPAMRDTSLSDDTNAASAAEAAIDTAISSDAAAYNDIEQQAVTALTDARAAHDADHLLAVATVYPNSKAAADARQDAVHLFEANNQPEQAIAVLRRMYASASDGDTKAHLLESIANDFLLMPNGLGPAIDRVCKAARSTTNLKISQPINLADGTTLTGLTYTDAIAKLRQLQADQENAELPDFRLAGYAPHLTTPFVRGSAPVIADVTAIVHPLRDFTRQDQILTWGPAGLSMYPAGATTPAFTVAEVKDPPTAAAWAGDKWLVWTATQLFQLDSQGKVVWSISIDHLPTMLVSAGGDAIVDDTAEPSPDDAMINNNGRLMQINGQVIRVQGGANVVLNGRRGLMRWNGVGGPGAGLVPVAPPVAPVAGQLTDEQIVAVQPAGDQLVISTSIGRVVVLGLRNGQPIWQTRLIDHAIDQLLANAHFTVVRIDDPGGSQIAVYETPTGRLIGKRRFGPDNTQNQLVNVALSEEAMLALTLYSRVVVKDLYDPWKSAPTELVAQANRDAAPFVGMNAPDQLLIKGGRLVCLYDSGSFARAYDLSKNADPTNPLATGASSAAVSLRLVGPRLFVVTSSRMHQYNLTDPADNYDAALQRDFAPPRIRGMMLGKDHAVMIDDPVDRGPAGSTVVRLVSISRALVPGKTREQGFADWDWTEPPGGGRNSSIGITDWLGAEGTIYFLTKDGNLHMLRGARQ